jgi:predicted ATPase/class 3 adenylate cyclase
MSKRKELEEAITALEAQRDVLGDSVVDPAIAAMRKQLDDLTDTQRTPKQQRKLITVLFMDVVDSTKLMGELDPEENLAIMDTVLQQLATPVETYGGRVTRFMGDGYLAIFGLPLAQENDPEMAVRAGLEILEQAKIIAPQLEEEWNLKGFQVRVGVNTGLVVTGGGTEAEDTVMGSAVNLAARLESSASPGGLLISQDTYQHVRGLFDVEQGEAIMMKGFSEPIDVFLVKNVKPSTFRVLSRGIEGIDTPMVGRERELLTLKESVKFIIQNKENKFYTVVGDDGLGKSRLLHELENWLITESIDFVFFKGRAILEMLGLPYGLLRDLIASSFGIQDDDPISMVKMKVVDRFRDVLGDIEDLEKNAIIVGHLLGYNFRDSSHIKTMLDNPRQLHDLAIMYLIRYFKSLTEKKPVIIFLDDIHWADESSLDILFRLTNELSDHQVLFIALSRPSIFERRSTWGNDPSHHLISLKPLSSKDSALLVQKILKKVENIPEVLIELIVSKAEGNPYYIEELVKILIEDEVIVRGTDHWHVIEERLTDLRVPATLTGILQARLDHLPDVDRNILQQAAVVGRTFWDAILYYINDSDEKLKNIDLGAVLTALRSPGLIFKHETSSFANAEEYIFNHVILREVTYESVLKRIRQDYHGLVADWMIEHGEERVSEFASLIAVHLENADRKDEALEYFSQAADAALSKYAVEEAEKFYDQALILVSANNFEKQYNLLLGKEAVLSMKGDRVAQRDTIESLTKIIDTLADEGKKGEVLMRRAWLAFWTGAYPEMLTIAQEARDLAEAIDKQELVQQATYAVAWAFNQLSDFNQALIMAQESLSLARELKYQRGEGNTLNILGMIKLTQGDFFTARNYLNGFLSIARSIGDLDRETTALNNLGVSLMRLGNFQEARNYYTDLLRISREMGDQVSTSTSLINLAWAISSQEEWEIALKYVEDGIVMKREFEHIEGIAEGLLWLGHCWVGLQKPEKAIPAYHEALAIRRKLNHNSLAMGVLAGLSRVALMQGELQTALEYVKEIVTHLSVDRILAGTWEPLRIYLTCFQVLQAGEDPLAQKILTDAHELLQEYASQIPNEEDRQMFLENIPWHREIIQQWGQQADSSP